MGELQRFTGKFSFIVRFFSPAFKRRLAKDLRQAGIGYSPDDYLSLGFGLAIACSFLGLGALSFLPDYLPATVVIFMVSFFAVIIYPRFRKARVAKEIEKGLPDFLRMTGIELGMGLPFETAVRNACSNTPWGREIGHVLRNMEQGSNAQEAFGSFADRIDSNFAKRAAAQLVVAYEKGGTGETLKKLADEQESIIRARLKEYNGKLAVYSLLFIAMSAVFPAVLQAFVIVGSSFMNIDVSPIDALLLPIAVFPALNIVLFIFVSWKKP